MTKFKDAAVVAGRIILPSSLTKQEADKFLADWYGNSIPIFKPVGYMEYEHTKFASANDNTDTGYKNFEVMEMLRDFVPVRGFPMRGSFVKYKDQVELKSDVQEHVKFLKKYGVHATNDTVSYHMGIFRPSVDMDNIAQVYCSVKRDDLARIGRSDLSNLPSSFANQVLDIYGVNGEEESAIVPMNVEVSYSDFKYFGYDSIVLDHEDKVVDTLIRKSIPALYVEGDSGRLRSPIIILYRGTGCMDSHRIRNELFEYTVKEFHPYNSVLFSLSEYIFINQSDCVEGSSEIRYFSDRAISPNGLQEILRYYGGLNE